MEILAYTLSGLSLYAHEVRPAYFSVTQQNDNTFLIVWKVPAIGEAIPKIFPVIPKNWKISEDREIIRRTIKSITGKFEKNIHCRNTRWN